MPQVPQVPCTVCFQGMGAKPHLNLLFDFSSLSTLHPYPLWSLALSIHPPIASIAILDPCLWILHLLHMCICRQLFDASFNSSPLNVNPYPLLIYCSRYNRNEARPRSAPRPFSPSLEQWVQSLTHFLLSDRDNCFPFHLPVIWPSHQLTPFVSSCPGPCDGEAE